MDSMTDQSMIAIESKDMCSECIGLPMFSGTLDTAYILRNPLNTKLKGLMKSAHVITISC